MAEKRLDWIDNARGIAIILVVMWYVVSSYHEAGLYESNTFYNFISHFIYSFQHGTFHVDKWVFMYTKEKQK